MSAKLTIEQMHALAKERGGVCLSTVYVNNSTKLRWRCSEGHEWEATPSNVKRLDSWCPGVRGDVARHLAAERTHTYYLVQTGGYVHLVLGSRKLLRAKTWQEG